MLIYIGICPGFRGGCGGKRRLAGFLTELFLPFKLVAEARRSIGASRSLGGAPSHAHASGLSPGNGFWGRGGSASGAPHLFPFPPSLAAPNPSLPSAGIARFLPSLVFISPFPPHSIPLPAPGWMENRTNGSLGPFGYRSVTFLTCSGDILSFFSPGRLTRRVLERGGSRRTGTKETLTAAA